MDDICVPLSYVMPLGALTLGLLLGVIIMGIRLRRTQRRLEQVTGRYDMAE
jgi:hypothetical protein